MAKITMLIPLSTTLKVQKAGLKKCAGGVSNGPSGSSTVTRETGHMDKNYPGEGFRCVINTDKPLPVN